MLKKHANVKNLRLIQIELVDKRYFRSIIMPFWLFSYFSSLFYFLFYFLCAFSWKIFQSSCFSPSKSQKDQYYSFFHKQSDTCKWLTPGQTILSLKSTLKLINTLQLLSTLIFCFELQSHQTQQSTQKTIQCALHKLSCFCLWPFPQPWFFKSKQNPHYLFIDDFSSMSKYTPNVEITIFGEISYLIKEKPKGCSIVACQYLQSPLNLKLFVIIFSFACNIGFKPIRYKCSYYFVIVLSYSLPNFFNIAVKLFDTDQQSITIVFRVLMKMVKSIIDRLRVLKQLIYLFLFAKADHQQYKDRQCLDHLQRQQISKVDLSKTPFYEAIHRLISISKLTFWKSCSQVIITLALIFKLLMNQLLAFEYGLTIIMSIINSNRFKSKLRFSTEPSYTTEQTLNHNSYQKNSKIQPNLRYHKDNSNNRQSYKRDQAEHPSFKPATSQVVYIDTDKLQTKVGVFGKQGKKRRNLKHLKLELPKQLVQSKHLRQQLRRSLSKEGQSSIDSVRIHKIRSNLGIEAKKEYVDNRQPFKPSRAYKFEEKKDQYQEEKQQKKLIKTMLIEKGSSKQIRLASKSKINQKEKIQQIKKEFYKLKKGISAINAHFNVDNPYQCLMDSIKSKNKIAAARIMFRVLNKNDPRLMFWNDYLISNLHEARYQ